MEANVVVLGTDSVGKSALTVRLLTRRFIGEYGDIESIYSHSFIADGREISFSIWDSPYSEMLRELKCRTSQDPSAETSPFQKKVRWADGFLLVYSICDRASFNAVGKLVQSIKSTKELLGDEKVPIAIVGNKRDLHHRRTVPSEEGRLLALDADCLFYEVSAAENYHSVLTAFHGLVERMRDAKLATTKRPLRLRGIVKSMSAVFARRRTDSL
ncbi:si:dkeyp-59c12.1 [Kryptolebias marmoratus]|uniref:small monomeric GTPase n=1 Tax=Kryptolebias marmoratus TaxID=37003 RepID=A0A3Q3AXV7_KRYMA|nr:si:dkeyp-59c12.1 [Kryptolebias marmoratus]